jgi:hypothetical protein
MQKCKLELIEVRATSGIERRQVLYETRYHKYWTTFSMGGTTEGMSLEFLLANNV